MLPNLEVGAFVKASYKSGEYIGELLEIRETKAVVKILAVLQHPIQGDLHHPFEAEVPFFHQRKALSYQEKALITFRDIVKYELPIPDYESSLSQAIEDQLTWYNQKNDNWARKAIAALEEVRKEYYS